MEKIGKFKVHKSIVYHPDFHEILSEMKFVPLGIDYVSINDIFIYTGMSSLFDPLPKDEMIPEYRIASEKRDEKIVVNATKL